MKSKTEFDPDFQADARRGPRPVRWIVATAIVLALGAEALRAGPIVQRRPGPWPPVQGRIRIPQMGTPPRDPFVIVAPAEIDPEMVVRAREDIDPEMVFNPETRRRGSAPGGRAPIIVAPVPAPVPGWGWPR